MAERTKLRVICNLPARLKAPVHAVSRHVINCNRENVLQIICLFPAENNNQRECISACKNRVGKGYQLSGINIKMSERSRNRWHIGGTLNVCYRYFCPWVIVVNFQFWKYRPFDVSSVIIGDNSYAL